MQRARGGHPLPVPPKPPNPFSSPFLLPPSKRESLPQTHRSAKGIRKGFRSRQPPAMATEICRVRSATRSLVRRIAGSLLPCRSFGAAALSVEYGSEWEEEYGCDRWAAAHVAKDAWGEREERGVRWVFLGSPGVQKHVYATRIAELLEVPYISMGTIVRQELNPRSALYKKIANAVNEGKLVPEDIIFGLLSKRLEEGYHRGEVGFILDGIPRTRIQAEILDEITDIDLVVNFKCVEDCLVKKHFGSEICLHCGKSFDAGNSESTSLNLCLSTRTQHAFPNTSSTIDVEDARTEKFRVYAEQSKLLEDFYKNKKKLLDFQVSGGPRETWQGLLATLHLQHIDATSSSQKLTV